MKMAMLVSALTKQQMAAANVLLSIFAIAAGKDYQKVDDIPEKKQHRQGFKTYNSFPDT